MCLLYSGFDKMGKRCYSGALDSAGGSPQLLYLLDRLFFTSIVRTYSVLQ